FVILIGTVVNNAILIVHQALLQIRTQNQTPAAAVLEGVRKRIRPIFMTTATTVCGLSPLVFFPGAGSELYRGLGSVVLGGLVISTIFTLFLIPTLFTLMVDAQNALAKHHDADQTKTQTSVTDQTDPSNASEPTEEPAISSNEDSKETDAEPSEIAPETAPAISTHTGS
ncbi:MAG: efflux RND transporter permease subunit, partial [Pirellulaceae bacterium]|nr:efflux RND transporter permease subunit [Pirellulaceae bacterium]